MKGTELLLFVILLFLALIIEALAIHGDRSRRQAESRYERCCVKPKVVYPLQSYLGGGWQGSVFKTNDYVLITPIPRKECLNILSVSDLNLSGFIDYISSFSCICPKTKREEVEDFEDDQNPEEFFKQDYRADFFVLVEEQAEKTFRQYDVFKLDEKSALAIAFTLLYSAYVADKKIYFRHDDLKADNLMVKDVNNPVHRCFTYSALDEAGIPLTDMGNRPLSRQFCGKSATPLFIDLGLATVGQNGNTDSSIALTKDSSKDITQILGFTIPGKIKYQTKAGYLTYLHVLNHPLFISNTLSESNDTQKNEYKEDLPLPGWMCMKKGLRDSLVACTVEVKAGNVLITKKDKKPESFSIDKIGKEMKDNKKAEGMKCLNVGTAVVCSNSTTAMNLLMSAPLY